MFNILNIKESPMLDDSITGVQYHAYSPYTTSFKNNDEIRIAIQQQDLYLLPHESFIYIEGVIEKSADAAVADVAPNFINNCVTHLFDEMRYELNSFEIDRCKNVGVTSTMKGYVSFSSNDVNRLRTASWDINSEQQASEGYFNFCIPLKLLFGFVEDYRSVIINVKHELIMVRSRFDTNLYVGNNNISTMTIRKIQWRIPHVNVSDSEKLKLLKLVDKKQSIHMSFRSWELYEYPILPQTDKHIWSVKTSTQINKPRYMIIGFQTKRNNEITADMSHFDHCNLTDLKVYLNSECYPYENLNVDFEKNQYAILYDMYAKFQDTYYHDRSLCSPILNFDQFKIIAPLIVIDCSRQNESLKKAIVDIRIVMQTKNNMPANTTAYCLIIHDNLITYNPYTNIVNRSI